jgi:hypothetical protein
MNRVVKRRLKEEGRDFKELHYILRLAHLASLSLQYKILIGTTGHSQRTGSKSGRITEAGVNGIQFNSPEIC